MAYCTVNGVPVVSARITLPRAGVWHADFEMPDDSVRSGAVRVEYAAGLLRLAGTVRYGGVEAGAALLHVVGGAGGFPVAMTPRAYRNAPRSTVVNDILGAAGERLSDASDKSWLSAQLPFWNIMATSAANALALLVSMSDGTSWRVLPDGTVYVGKESWAEVRLPYSVLERHPGEYAMQIDLEMPRLLPGYTFAGQRVSTVEYILEPAGRYAMVYFEAPTQ